MKKLLFAVICIIGVQSSSIAQEGTSSDDFEETSKDSRNLYVAFGAAFNGNYRINENLKASEMPQLAETMPEVTFGLNFTGEQYLIDVEFNGGYLNTKRGEGRLNVATSGVKLRGHYVPFKTESFFISAGADVSYIANIIDLYNKQNVIDMNDLQPLNYTGHINLNNELLYAGPSVAVGLFQKTNFPVRLNMGYEWALTNGYWDSDFADVYNSVKENGHNRFYAKVTLYL